MISNMKVPYRVLLPDWVFLTAYTDEQLFENAKKYLLRRYPERILIEVKDSFAICEMKN